MKFYQKECVKYLPWSCGSCSSLAWSPTSTQALDVLFKTTKCPLDSFLILLKRDTKRLLAFACPYCLWIEEFIKFKGKQNFWSFNIHIPGTWDLQNLVAANMLPATNWGRKKKGCTIIYLDIDNISHKVSELVNKPWSCPDIILRRSPLACLI